MKCYRRMHDQRAHIFTKLTFSGKLGSLEVKLWPNFILWMMICTTLFIHCTNLWSRLDLISFWLSYLILWYPWMVFFFHSSMRFSSFWLSYPIQISNRFQCVFLKTKEESRSGAENWKGLMKKAMTWTTLAWFSERTAAKNNNFKFVFA